MSDLMSGLMRLFVGNEQLMSLAEKQVFADSVASIIISVFVNFVVLLSIRFLSTMKPEPYSDEDFMKRVLQGCFWTILVLVTIFAVTQIPRLMNPAWYVPETIKSLIIDLIE